MATFRHCPIRKRLFWRYVARCRRLLRPKVTIVQVWLSEPIKVSYRGYTLSVPAWKLMARVAIALLVHAYYS
jgi:hypothetical protein